LVQIYLFPSSLVTLLHVLDATIFSYLLLLVGIFITLYPLSIVPTLFTKKLFHYIICCIYFMRWFFCLFLLVVTFLTLFTFSMGLVYLFDRKLKSITSLFLQIVIWLTILTILTYLFLIANEFINMNEERGI
jgi:hypothetical protein